MNDINFRFDHQSDALRSAGWRKTFKTNLFSSSLHLPNEESKGEHGLDKMTFWYSYWQMTDIFLQFQMELTPFQPFFFLSRIPSTSLLAFSFFYVEEVGNADET